MLAKTLKGNSPEEIKTGPQQSIADGYKPTLAIVFMSVKQDRKAVGKVLDDKGIAIYGATSNGEFTGERISSGEIAMMLLDLNPSYFHILFEEFSEIFFRQTTKAIAKEALENFALEHSMTLNFQLQREIGDPVLRAGLLGDWNVHSYYCSGSVPQGSKVRFTLPPEFDVIEKTILEMHAFTSCTVALKEK